MRRVIFWAVLFLFTGIYAQTDTLVTFNVGLTAGSSYGLGALGKIENGKNSGKLTLGYWKDLIGVQIEYSR